MISSCSSRSPPLLRLRPRGWRSTALSRRSSRYLARSRNTIARDNGASAHASCIMAREPSLLSANVDKPFPDASCTSAVLCRVRPGRSALR